MADVLCVDPAKVEQIWPHVEDFIKRGISRGPEDFDQLKQNIHSGLSLIWIAWDEKGLGVAVTGLFGDACEIISLAGTGLKGWVHSIESIESYARAEGCKRMRLIGRKGWCRVLKDYRIAGYQQKLFVLEKEF